MKIVVNDDVLRLMTLDHQKTQTKNILLHVNRPPECLVGKKEMK